MKRWLSWFWEVFGPVMLGTASVVGAYTLLVMLQVLPPGAL